MPVWKLIGFVIYVILYYSVLDAYTVWPVASLKSVFFKTMPIMHLIFVVISTSMDEDIKPKNSRYRWNIAFGLIACGIGDGWVVFVDFPGVLMSSIGHLFYIRAFGIRPLGSGPVAASFAVAAVAAYFLIIDMLPVLMVKVTVGIYLLVLFTVAWRSMVVLQNERSFDSFFACFGSIVFIASAVLCIVTKFRELFNQGPFWVMLTYYVAQLGIALSACNSHSIYDKRE